MNATVQLDRWGIGSPWSEEGAAINVGAELRKDSVDFDPDEFSETGDIAGFSEQVFPIRGSIGANEIFGEARIPLVADKLVRRLALEGGFRKSWYDNPRSKFSSDAYKLALDLAFVTGLRLRASLQGANRAPTSRNFSLPLNPAPLLAIRAPAFALASETQCALTGVTPAQYGHVVKINATLFGYNAIMGGNADLQPEIATTRTIGLVLEPRFLRGLQRYDRLVGHQAEWRRRKNRRADDYR